MNLGKHRFSETAEIAYLDISSRNFDVVMLNITYSSYLNIQNLIRHNVNGTINIFKFSSLCC